MLDYAVDVDLLTIIKCYLPIGNITREAKNQVWYDFFVRQYGNYK